MFFVAVFGGSTPGVQPGSLGSSPSHEELYMEVITINEKLIDTNLVISQSIF